MKFLAALAIFAGIAGAQSTPITGVWQVTEWTTTGSNGRTISNPQPALYIFTGKYYSKLVVRGDKPRPNLSSNPTDAERLASFLPLLAQSGTYEVSGATLTTHIIVSQTPNRMSPGDDNTYSFKLEGKTLTITDISEGNGPKPNPVTVKFTRVE
jgi:hypothetical protein